MRTTRRTSDRVVLRTFRVPSAAGSDAPTYVLLHGIGLSHREFTGLARLLSATGRVISFDLPGYGVSPRPRRQVSIEEHARLIAAAIADEGGPLVVIGHSMGAQFAIEVALVLPTLVSHVVLIGPVVDPARPTLRAQAAALMRDAPLEPVPTQLMVLANYALCGVPWFAAQSIVMRDYPTAVRAQGLIQPMLIIRGAHDPIAKPAWVEWLSGQVRDGRVLTIDGKRHNVAHSGPATIAAAVERFLRDTP